MLQTYLTAVSETLAAELLTVFRAAYVTAATPPDDVHLCATARDLGQRLAQTALDTLAVAQGGYDAWQVNTPYWAARFVADEEGVVIEIGDRALACLDMFPRLPKWQGEPPGADPPQLVIYDGTEIGTPVAIAHFYPEATRVETDLQTATAGGAAC